MDGSLCIINTNLFTVGSLTFTVYTINEYLILIDLII